MDHYTYTRRYLNNGQREKPIPSCLLILMLQNKYGAGWAVARAYLHSEKSLIFASQKGVVEIRAAERSE